MTGNQGTSLLPGLLVSPTWLAAAWPHPALCLIDVREAANYDEGHITGAVQLDLASLSQELDGVPGMLLPAELFASKMGQLGISQERAVVLYDDNWGLPAARVLWALARYGHDNVSILNGGIDRWRDEGYGIQTEPVSPRPTSFEPQARDEHLASRAWLEEKLADPDVVLLDTRAPGEFAAGHLPGAICWDWINGVPLASWNALRSAAELEKELARLGVTPEKEVVTYCRSGARAAHTYLLLRHLGFPRVHLYDGSWLDWSRVHHSDEEKGK